MCSSWRPIKQVNCALTFEFPCCDSWQYVQIIMFIIHIFLKIDPNQRILCVSYHGRSMCNLPQLYTLRSITVWRALRLESRTKSLHLFLRSQQLFLSLRSDRKRMEVSIISSTTSNSAAYTSPTSPINSASSTSSTSSTPSKSSNTATCMSKLQKLHAMCWSIDRFRLPLAWTGATLYSTFHDQQSKYWFISIHRWSRRILPAAPRRETAKGREWCTRRENAGFRDCRYFRGCIFLCCMLPFMSDSVVE